MSAIGPVQRQEENGMYFYYDKRPYYDDNIRVQDTKLRIYYSMIRMLKERPLDKITISDICSQAYVSRGAFYNHFSNKMDIIKEIMELIVYTYSDLLVKMNDEKKVTLLDVYQVLCHIFWRNRDFFLLLDRNNLKILDEYCAHLTHNLYMYFGNIKINDSPHEQFILHYYGGATASVLLHWFYGAQDFSVNEMAMLLLQLSPCRNPLPSNLA